MAAPTPTTRTLPTGWKMPEGYQALITLSSLPGINLWEKAVTPPMIDGGDPLKTTTQHNITVRTLDAPHLITIGPEMKSVCSYDPDVISDLMGKVNVNQTITVKFPDASTWCFYGYLQKAEFGELKEDEHPEITITWAVTNWDPSAHVEAVPVFSAASGT